MLYSLKLILLNLPFSCLFVLAFPSLVQERNHLGNYIWGGKWTMSLLGFRLLRVTVQLQGSPQSCCSIKEPWSPCLAIQDSPWHLLPPCMFQASRALCPWVGLFAGASALCPGSFPAGEPSSTTLSLSLWLLPRFSSWLSRVGRAFLLCSCDACVCHVLFHLSAGMCPASRVVLNQYLWTLWVDFIFILYSNQWMVCLPTTVWGQGSCPVIITCLVPDRGSQNRLNGRQARLTSRASILAARRVFLALQSFVLSLECTGRTSFCGFVTGARESQNAVG